MEKARRRLKSMHDGDRQMVQILSCVPDDGLQAVEAACREAVDQGVHSAPVVINILARRRDPTPPPLRVSVAVAYTEARWWPAFNDTSPQRPRP